MAKAGTTFGLSFFWLTVLFCSGLVALGQVLTLLGLGVPPAPPPAPVVTEQAIDFSAVDAALLAHDHELAQAELDKLGVFGSPGPGKVRMNHVNILTDLHYAAETAKAGDWATSYDRAFAADYLVSQTALLPGMEGLKDEAAAALKLATPKGKAASEKRKANADCEQGKTVRQGYATLFEQNALSNGQDVTARIGGKCGTELVITWVLCSRPTVYQMQQSGEAAAVGFKKIRCNDGFGGGATGEL